VLHLSGIERHDLSPASRASRAVSSSFSSTAAALAGSSCQT
jgi:hypothetical protein